MRRILKSNASQQGTSYAYFPPVPSLASALPSRHLAQSVANAAGKFSCLYVCKQELISRELGWAFLASSLAIVVLLFSEFPLFLWHFCHLTGNAVDEDV